MPTFSPFVFNASITRHPVKDLLILTISVKWYVSRGEIILRWMACFLLWFSPPPSGYEMEIGLLLHIFPGFRYKSHDYRMIISLYLGWHAYFLLVIWEKIKWLFWLNHWILGDLILQPASLYFNNKGCYCCFMISQPTNCSIICSLNTNRASNCISNNPGI